MTREASVTDDSVTLEFCTAIQQGGYKMVDFELIILPQSQNARDNLGIVSVWRTSTRVGKTYYDSTWLTTFIDDLNHGFFGH